MMSQLDRERLSVIDAVAIIEVISEIYGINAQVDARIDELLLKHDPKTSDNLSASIQALADNPLAYREEHSLIAHLNQLTFRIMSLKTAQPFASLTLLAQLLQTSALILPQFCGDKDNNNDKENDSNDVFFEYRNIAQLWFDTARSCLEIDYQNSETSSAVDLNQGWQDRVAQLCDHDPFGVTHQMLKSLYKLLPKANIQALISNCQKARSELMAEKPQNSAKIAVISQRMEALSAATKDAGIFEHNFLNLYANDGLENQTLARMLQFFCDVNGFDRALYYLNEVWQLRDNDSQLARLDWLTKIYDKQGASEHKLATMEEAFSLDPNPKRLQSILQQVPSARRDQWQQQALALAKKNQNLIQKLPLLFELGETALADNAAVQLQDTLDTASEDDLQQLLLVSPKSAYLTQVVIYRALLKQALAQRPEKFSEKALKYYQQLAQLDTIMTNQQISYQALVNHDEFSQSLNASWPDVLPKG